MSAPWRAELKATVGRLELDVALGGDAGVVALVGPNGSGKTTVLRLIAGAAKADNAHVEVGGKVLASTAREIDVPIEERRIGYVPQGYGLFPHLTAVDNVAFGLSTGPQKLPKADRRARARDILKDLDCLALAGRRVERLSGGEQQRVALARALVIEPELLLLDEPLAALDATTRRAVRGFLAERLKAFGRPSLLVTHDVRDVRALEATVFVLEGGCIVQSGDVDALALQPATDFVAEFVGVASG